MIESPLARQLSLRVCSLSVSAGDGGSATPLRDGDCWLGVREKNGKESVVEVPLLAGTPPEEEITVGPDEDEWADDAEKRSYDTRLRDGRDRGGAATGRVDAGGQDNRKNRFARSKE